MSFATSGESQGVGTGPAGFGGAGCPGADDVDAGGFAAAGAPGVAGFATAGAVGAAGFAGVAGAAGAAAFGGVVGVEVSDGGEGFAGTVVVSDWTEPEGVAFSPPGLAGWSAVGLDSFPGGVGDLGSSGISREGKPSAQSAF